MKEEKIRISDYIISRRKNEGLTIRAFANKYGVSKSIISRYEKGDMDHPSTLLAERFCKTFDLDFDYFLVHFDGIDEKTAKALRIAKQIGQRLTIEFSDTYSEEVVSNFFNQYANTYNLKNYSPSKYLYSPDKDYPDAYIEHQAECTINNNKVYLSSFLHPINYSNRAKSKNFSYIGKAIADIACYSKEELKAQNFIIFVPSDEVYDFYTKRDYNTSNNSLYLVLVRDKDKFSKPKLLFGKGFLKNK